MLDKIKKQETLKLSSFEITQIFKKMWDKNGYDRTSSIKSSSELKSSLK